VCVISSQKWKGSIDAKPNTVLTLGGYWVISLCNFLNSLRGKTTISLATPIKSRADRVDVNHLLKEIAKGVRVPTGGRRKSKPHLIISAPFYKKDERLTRENYIERTREAIDELTPLMEVVKACF
jgi:hypothetical protein